MNSKYYVSVVIENNQYIGHVYQTSNNTLVFSSKPYNSQEQVTAEIRKFIVTTNPDTSTPQAVVSTASYSAPRQPAGKCCGRR